MTEALTNEGTFTLRPYQVDAVNSVYREWRNVQSTVVVMATGLGKTVLLSDVIIKWPLENGDAMLIAHREELIDQGACKIADHNGGTMPLIEMGTQRVSGKALPQCTDNVYVSSVQTQNSGRQCQECHGEGCDGCLDGMRYRMCKFRNVGLLIIDEGHHAAARTYRRMIKWYQRCNPDLKILMVTATPKRHDNIGLHNVCDSVAYEMPILDGISEGWLVPIRQRVVRIDGLDFSWIKKKAGGDMQDGQVEQAMLGMGDETERERMLHEVVSPTLQEANGRPILVFAAGQEHARRLSDVFNRHPGVDSEVVIDSTPKADRQMIVDRFRKGRLQVLVGCGVFLEGFDAPQTAVICVARPTGSESLYTQMVGRGTRPLDGIVDGHESSDSRRSAIAHSAKPHCTVLDFVGNSGKHKLVSCVDVLAGGTAPDDLWYAREIAEEDDESQDVLEILEEARIRRLREEAEERRQERVEKERQERIAAAERARLVGHATYDTEDVDPFGHHAVPQVASDSGPRISDKQIAFLQKLGVSRRAAEGFSRRQASVVIDKLKKGRGGEFIVTFGKHAGKKVKNIPTKYLNWIAQKFEPESDVVQNIRQYFETA